VKSEAEVELEKLVEFFRGEGYGRFGWNGDIQGWSPAETAIHAMLECVTLSVNVAALKKERDDARTEVERIHKLYDYAHPRSPHEKRDEIEMFLRDAYAAGCRAAQQRSLVTAMEYAAKEAPVLRRLLSSRTDEAKP
jgi:hypothetical protein